MSTLSTARLSTTDKPVPLGALASPPSGSASPTPPEAADSTVPVPAVPVPAPAPAADSSSDEDDDDAGQADKGGGGVTDEKSLLGADDRDIEARLLHSLGLALQVTRLQALIVQCEHRFFRQAHVCLHAVKV